jgi:YfiH family protein
MDLVEKPGLPPLLHAPDVLGGFAHGFTMRAGGVSVGPYASLNMGRRWGDAWANVQENRRRAQAACSASHLYLVRQVHGAGVLQVTAETSLDAAAAAEVDAACTDVPGVAVGIFTADCVPLLVGDPTSGAVAAIHAGWRGVVAGVVPATLALMAEAYGSRTAELRVALGPAIGPCCFEVGLEVVAAFDAVPGARAAGAIHDAGAAAGSKPHIDLKRVLQVQLAAAGVPAANVAAGTECTMCDPAGRFYSYRRDNTQTGQHLSLIVAGTRPPVGGQTPRPEPLR